MIRKALIIYCTNTESGRLTGPRADNTNYINFLKSPLGGNWSSSEIMTIENPKFELLQRVLREHMANANYTFIIFSGHGGIGIEDRKQYMEIDDRDITIGDLRTDANRQTIIIDSCRGLYSIVENLTKAMDEVVSFSGQAHSTRQLFNDAVMRAEEGMTILYAASTNQSALDTNKGGAYLVSLLAVAKIWRRDESNRKSSVFTLDAAHEKAVVYLRNNFEETIQVPVMNQEKRRLYFPFAVKFIQLND